MSPDRGNRLRLNQTLQGGQVRCDRGDITCEVFIGHARAPPHREHHLTCRLTHPGGDDPKRVVHLLPDGIRTTWSSTPNGFGGANSTVTVPIGESATQPCGLCRSSPAASPAAHRGQVCGSAANS